MRPRASLREARGREKAAGGGPERTAACRFWILSGCARARPAGRALAHR